METTFIKQEAEGMVAYKCSTCARVFLDGENQDHDCREVTDPDAIQLEKLLEFKEGMTGAQYMENFKKWEELREVRFKDKFLPLLEKQFPIHAMSHLIRQEFEWRLGRVREMRDQCYEEYGKYRKSGVPLQERRKMLNTKKIEWCDKEEKKTIENLRRFRVRPWRDWRGNSFLAADDWVSIQRLGFKLFLRVYLERFYYLIEQKNEKEK